ncbi:hypothetical protein EGW08_003997 [Elysia chlorotica]|uniref:Clathrin light chain n=1 Tax=Elysia chlorotica TaxID=188477 RepID=A0A433U341_ELYCH|nr:hypothetical protein EGW08_003997 [Elysia chlorotica]
MADFEAFNSAPSEEVDPAADFLAREQSELAGLEDDTFDQQPVDNNQEFDAFEQPGQEPAQPETQSEPVDDVGPMGDFELVNGTDGDAGLLGESDGGLVNGLGDPAAASTNGPSNIYEAISQHDTVRAEPEKIKIWREEQRKRLEAKDKEEEVRKKELREKAKKELDDWYKHHQEQQEKTKENNRKHNDVTESQGASEEAFVKERDEKVSGQSWEKITKLCNFNPKNTKCTKDVARFRSILLQLKQTPLVR